MYNHSNKMKCLGINITKHVQNFHHENYTTLMKEIKDLNRQKDIPCSWIGKPL